MPDGQKPLTELDVVRNMRIGAQNAMTQETIMERFYVRHNLLKPSKEIDGMIKQTQQKIAFSKLFISFLESQEKDLCQKSDTSS